jgi:flagellar basal body rod protein FlgC
MISAITSALSGLTNATKQVETAAQNIAEGGGDEGRIIEDVVDIKLAETAYKANIETIRTANELSEELLKIFDERV